MNEPDDIEGMTFGIRIALVSFGLLVVSSIIVIAGTAKLVSVVN